MKKVLSVLLIFMLLFSAVYAFPFEQASAQEEDTTLKTDTYLPEEEYTEEIYEGTGSLEYAFDGTFIRDYVDNETLDEAGHVARINEEEALNTYVFLNRDGTKSVYYMDDNVRYVDENGETVEKDLTIIRKNKGYTLKANDVKLWFPDVLSDGISVKYDKYHLTLYPQGVADTEEVIIDEYERITYPGVFGENTVLAYTPTLSGLKEDIILSEYTGQLSYDFFIHTHGMRILEQDGKYIVKKPGNGNKETFELGAVQIYDSAGNFCVGEMKITEQNNGSKYILTLIAPEEFLTDPDTVYPVTIDPSITVSDNLNGANSIEDSVIYQGTPNSNYGGFTYLTVGYGDSTYGVGRAIFRLPGLYNSDLYNSLSASQITSVKFYTWDASGHDNLPINVLANVNIPWTESGVKWNNAPGGYPGLSPVTANMPSGNFACFDITSIVEWWKAGNSPAGGFTMKNPNETSDLYKKVPCSSETAITDRRPYVVMTYNTSLTITPSTNYLPGGANLQLSVSSNETLQSVVWSSSNTSVAQVSGTGLLSTGTVGRTVITATVTFASGGQQTVQKELYVIYPYNVIRIKNNNSNKYLNVNQGMIENGAHITQYSSTSNALTPQEQFQQRWKVKYVGDGMYTLRPYHKLDMCLFGHGVNGYVVTQKYTTDSNPVENIKWAIEWKPGGYILKYSGNSSATLQIQNASTSENARVVTASDTGSDNCRWTFSIVNNPASGVILYDTEEQQQIIYNENDEPKILYIAPEEVRSLEELGVCAAMYSPTKIDQTFTLSKRSSYIELTPEEKVKGVKYSDNNYGTLVFTSEALSSDNTGEVRIKVTAIPNSTYYIRNIETRKYIGVDDGIIGNGKILEQETFDPYDEQKWTFTLCPDGYYTISLADYPSYYMRINSNDSDLIISNSVIDSDAKWQVTLSSEGNYIFKPQTAVDSENEDEQNDVAGVNGYVFNTDGVNIVLRSYTDDDDYKDEWELYNLVISMVNYYDSSFDAELVEMIDEANDFVEQLFLEVFDLSIKMDGVAESYNSATSNGCGVDPNNPSNYITCKETCGEFLATGDHCTSTCRISDHFYNAPTHKRENNHIYILWTNRGLGVYCNDEPTHQESLAYASVYSHRPVVAIYAIPGASTENQKMAMSLILAHEIVHTFGLDDVYDDDSHCSDGSNCIMNRLETVNHRSDNYYITFYNDIIKYLDEESDESPFCEDCTAGIEELLATNQPIEGN